MKTLALIALVASPLLAEQFDTLTFDSSNTNGPAVVAPPGVYLVDVAETNRVKRNNPEFRSWMIFPPPPRLWSRATQKSIPWTGTITGSVDAAEQDASDLTDVQREGRRELRALKQAVGLPARATDAKLMRVLLENSRTNSTGTAGATATRLLSRAQSALWLQEYVKPESDQ